MPQNWAEIRDAYPKLVDPLKFLYELPNKHSALKVENGKGETHKTFSAYPRVGRKLNIYNVCPYDNPLVYFQTAKFGELLGSEAERWFKRKLTEAFGSDIREGPKKYFWVISLADIDKHRDAMERLMSDVGDRLSQR